MFGVQGAANREIKFYLHYTTTFKFEKKIKTRYTFQDQNMKNDQIMIYFNKHASFFHIMIAWQFLPYGKPLHDHLLSIQ